MQWEWDWQVAERKIQQLYHFLHKVSNIYEVFSFVISGVMTWDINRDTDQRMNFPVGADNLYQTGQGKAAFIDAISTVLNSGHQK